MKSITIYTDPAHGWAKVHLSELFNLEIWDKISPYSYIRSNAKYAWAYLEEDCDMPTFMLAASDHGYSLKITDIYHDKDAPCRFYPSF